PLSRIRLGLEMMGEPRDAELKAGLVQDIEDIDVAIGQFLDFARLRDAEMAIPDTDLNALVDNTVARYVHANKAVTFTRGEVPPLPIRQRAIQRLLGNLIDNALRHAGEPVNCITTLNSSDLQVIDETALVYKTGKTIYVARPTHPKQ
ncbi:MAG: hypothetical protein V4637_15900, partial [Pseudomonadota bacterium]